MYEQAALNTYINKKKLKLWPLSILKTFILYKFNLKSYNLAIIGFCLFTSRMRIPCMLVK